jgi:hypothetical protein
MVNELLVFPCGSVHGKKVCTDIDITNDQSFEKPDRFSVLVSSEDTQNVVIHEDTATVKIIDDDGKLSARAWKSASME